MSHAKAIIAYDFFVAVTATFRVLYVIVVIEHGRWRLAHVTATPTAEWTLQQLREIVGGRHTHRHLIHDRDRIFAKHLNDSIRALGLKVLKSPVASWKANAIRERVIGTIRRESLDWPIPISEVQLRTILKEWVVHCNGGCCHGALGRGVPNAPIEIIASTKVKFPTSIAGVRARSREFDLGRIAS